MEQAFRLRLGLRFLYQHGQQTPDNISLNPGQTTNHQPHIVMETAESDRLTGAFPRQVLLS